MRMRYTSSSIPSLKNKTVFFDANILIYIFWSPSPESKQTFEYASILSTLIKNEIQIAVSETVISEIINRALRLEFDKIKEDGDSFKNYRDSENGRNTQKGLYDSIHKYILNRFQIISESITKTEIESFLTVSKLDFNDKLIEQVCRKNNLVLLTHDSDFSSSDIDILSANPKLKNRI